MTENQIPDVQGSPDVRELAINRVGVKKITLPFAFFNGKELKNTVAEAELLVSLPKDKKGTHMSRFILLLMEEKQFSLLEMKALHQKMLKELNATEGTISFKFPYFIEKSAPVSGLKSLMNYQAQIISNGDFDKPEIYLEITVPVTSLCPCSKEISKYGAHNQRSHIIIKVLFDETQPISLEELAEIGEKGGSCPLWAALKRPDEKFVTEAAYENPKFVEDIVRDVALMLNQDKRVKKYRISSENFESIHNHSAFALIEK